MGTGRAVLFASSIRAARRQLPCQALLCCPSCCTACSRGNLSLSLQTVQVLGCGQLMHTGGEKHPLAMLIEVWQCSFPLQRGLEESRASCCKRPSEAVWRNALGLW